MEQSDSPRTIQSVERACEIIGTLEQEGAMTVTELTSDLDISKGTVHTHLATLLEEGFVAKSDDEYRLSFRQLRIAEQITDRIEIYDLVRDRLDELSSLTGERAQFAVPEDNQAVCVYRSEGENAIRSSLDIGDFEKFHCTAMGKAMLGYFPEERVDKVVRQHGLPSQTENTITTREQLDAELTAVRERGYAIDDEERVRGVQCFAAPIRDDDGKVKGAISISGPSRRMDNESAKTDVRDELLRTANIIEVNAELS